MSQTREGAIKIIARRIGVSVDEVKRHHSHGEKWCWKCHGWKGFTAFGLDPSRNDGYAVYCLLHRRVTIKAPWVPRINHLTGHPGPVPSIPRHGDKKQARERVHTEVRNGRMPSASDIPCMDCGHVFKPGELEHHYDHFKGYSIENHLEVQAVCSPCHTRRGFSRGELVNKTKRDMTSFGFEQLYEKHTVYELEEMTGVPAETIRRWLVKNGVKMRVRGTILNGQR